MPYRLSMVTRNQIANTVGGGVDSGPGPGVIEIRTGPPPLTVDSGDTGTLLATVVFEDPAFQPATAGTIYIVPTQPAIAEASGVAGHFRIKNSEGIIHSDGTCGEGSGDLSFNNATIVEGGLVHLTSFAIAVSGS